jgi:hypothetical protein
MTILKSILNVLINGSQSARDRAAMIQHRDAWLGKQGRTVARPACFYSF